MEMQDVADRTQKNSDNPAGAPTGPGGRPHGLFSRVRPASRAGQGVLFWQARRARAGLDGLRALAGSEYI